MYNESKLVFNKKSMSELNDNQLSQVNGGLVALTPLTVLTTSSAACIVTMEITIGVTASLFSACC